MTERKYALNRLAAGDWLCVSNDGAYVWRFHTHIDGKALGLECGYEERTFWRAVYMPVHLYAKLGAGEGLDPWSSYWTQSDWYLPSRKAAIDRMATL